MLNKRKRIGEILKEWEKASDRQIREALERTARDLGPAGRDNEYGWGLIDASAALEYYASQDSPEDGIAGLQSLGAFAQRWLKSDAAGADGSRPGSPVDFKDFASFALAWRP